MTTFLNQGQNIGHKFFFTTYPEKLVVFVTLTKKLNFYLFINNLLQITYQKTSL